MFNSLKLFFWRSKKSLRVRLTAWYLLLLGCTLMIFSSYLYLQLKYSLLGQLDATLKVTAAEVLANLVVESNHSQTLLGDRLYFNQIEQFRSNQQQLAQAGFAARLITLDGTISDGFGNYQTLKVIVPEQEGYQNLSVEDKVWRTYNLPLATAHSKITKATSKFNPPLYWLQVAQSRQPVTKALEHLLALILFGFPLVLIFANFGGLFLADRALRPIDGIIRIAEAIHPDDLTYRINYRGVTDEVGRLAMTLDRMLDRIELAFEHERRFIADASHELRTPLAVIKGRIGVTLARPRSEAEYQTTLQDLESHTDRLIRLTNGLLFLARLEHEQSKQSNFVEVNLTDLLEVLLEQIQFLATEHHLNLSAKILPNLFVWGDCDLLTSLFLNLLDNALKYTPADGQIQFETKLEEQKIIIAISNTGQGIAEADLPYLFDRFHRFNQDRDTQGSGLGLTIAALIARCHDGHISAFSQVQKLTIFEVILPQITKAFKHKNK